MTTFSALAVGFVAGVLAMRVYAKLGLRLIGKPKYLDRALRKLTHDQLFALADGVERERTRRAGSFSA